MPESAVGIAPDGGGPKVRTIKVTRMLDDGTYATEHQQVISVADANGNPIDVDTNSDKFARMIALLERIATGIDEITGTYSLGGEDIEEEEIV